MLFDPTYELVLPGRAEKVAAYGPGVDDRLQRQSGEQIGRLFGAGRVTVCGEVGKEDAGCVEGDTIGGHGPQFRLRYRAVIVCQHSEPCSPSVSVRPQIVDLRPHLFLLAMNGCAVQRDMRRFNTMSGVIAFVMPSVLPRVIPTGAGSLAALGALRTWATCLGTSSNEPG